MSHDQSGSYPSPNAGQVGGGSPFFTQQGAQHVPDEELGIAEHLSRDLGPNPTQMVHDGQRMDPRFAHPLHQQHMQPLHIQSQHIQPQHFHHMNQMQHGPQLGLQHVPQHGVQLAMQPGPQMNTGNTKADEGSARKKSKVSRACDECRRKKIRCDAISDVPDHPKCSNCTRTKAACEFSRQPMKRGPSKGYIKDLADRVEDIEKRYQAVVGAQAASPGADVAMGRKRSHSVAEDTSAQGYAESQQDGPNASNRIGSWSGVLGDPIHPRRAQPYGSGNTQAPTPNMLYMTHPNQDTTTNEDTTTMQQTSSPTHRILEEEEDLTMVRFAPWEEDVMQEYFRVVHPELPLLADTVDELRGMLRLLPGIRQGFYVAMSMIVGRLSTNALHHTTPRPASSEFLASLATLIDLNPDTVNADDIPDVARSLVHLQAYIMIIMAIDMDGASYSPDQVHRRSFWIGLATVLVERLELHRTQDQEKMRNDNLGTQKRRVYVAIVVADWFDAAGKGGPTHFQDHNTQLFLSDQAILGKTFYSLASLSRILSHVIPLISLTSLPQQELTAAEGVLRSTLTMSLSNELHTLHEGILPHFEKHPVLHAAYLHVKIFMLRVLAPFMDCRNLMSPTRDLCKLLNSNGYMRNGWTHQFVALAGHTAMDLCKYSEVNGEAAEALKELCNAIAVRNIMAANDKPVLRSALHKAFTAKLEAVEGVEARPQYVRGEKLDDLSELLRKGYVKVFER